MHSAKIIFLLGLNLGLLAATANEPNSARTVEGLVTYQGGEVVPQAVVQIEDVESKQVLSCIADENGRYHFKSLKMDKDYTLRATKNDHWSEIHHLSKFSGKRAEVVNLRLKADPE